MQQPWKSFLRSVKATQLPNDDVVVFVSPDDLAYTQSLYILNMIYLAAQEEFNSIQSLHVLSNIYMQMIEDESLMITEIKTKI